VTGKHRNSPKSWNVFLWSMIGLALVAVFVMVVALTVAAAN
jgi:purine-cytosine permease-like protein